MYKKSVKGFTLMELLLVMAILAILSAVVMVAINPTKHFIEARDAERQSEVYAIVNALHQYALDHESSFPENLTTEEREICQTGSVSCVGMYDLSILTDDEIYLITMPVDPECEQENSACGAGETGYLLSLTATGRISVSAPYAEEGEIAVTK